MFPAEIEGSSKTINKLISFFSSPELVSYLTRSQGPLINGNVGSRNKIALLAITIVVLSVSN